VAKFAAGDKVLVGFNPPAPDLRVPNQVNGVAPGRGVYQTEPDPGIILAALEDGSYLVEVELRRDFERNGRKQVAVSHRKRVVAERKLEAVA
jgi:hypothetical protein